MRLAGSLVPDRTTAPRSATPVKNATAPRASALEVLQRAAGNVAVGRLLAGARPAPAVQRTVEVGGTTYTSVDDVERLFARVRPSFAVERHDAVRALLVGLVTSPQPLQCSLAGLLGELRRGLESAAAPGPPAGPQAVPAGDAARAQALGRIREARARFTAWAADPVRQDAANFERALAISADLVRFPDLADELEIEALLGDRAADYQTTPGVDRGTTQVPADQDDLRGVVALTDDLLRRHPPATHRYLTLGASADLVYADLVRRGIPVRQLPLSGVPSWADLRSRPTLSQQRLVATCRGFAPDAWWADPRPVVVLDVISTGAALTTVGRLCAVIGRQVTAGTGSWQALQDVDAGLAAPVPVVLFALNRPTSSAAARLVGSGAVEAPSPGLPAMEYVMLRLRDQVLKDATRLTPKNHADAPSSSVVVDAARLQSLVERLTAAATPAGTRT